MLLKACDKISHDIKGENPLVAPHITVIIRLTFSPLFSNLKTNNTSISPSLSRQHFFVVLGYQISKYSPV